MSRPRTFRLPLGAIGLVLALIAPTTSHAAAAADPDRLPLVYTNVDWQLASPFGYWWQDTADGTWRVERARYRSDGRLDLTVTIQPPASALGLEPGPAVVVASMSMYGDGGGDTGVGLDAARFVSSPAVRCAAEEACALRARVVLPVGRLLARAGRIPRAYAWYGVYPSLVLVRTFARGSWVQVLPLRGDEEHGKRGGKVARPGTFDAHLRRYGMFSAEQSRTWHAYRPPTGDQKPSALLVARPLLRSVPDTTHRPVNVPVTLDIDPGDCDGWTLMTPTGDVAFDEIRTGTGRERRVVRVPIGTTWYVRAPSLENIDGPADTIVSQGPFVADGQRLTLSGALSCRTGPAGRVTAAVGALVGLGPVATVGRCDRAAAPRTAACVS